MRLVLHPKVYSDIDEIMGYYERVATPGLAEEFYTELRYFMTKAAEKPESFSTHQLFGEPERVNSFETIGDYEVVPRPMVPAFTLSDEAGLQATAGYLQRERCLSQLGNMRCAR